jgi:type VI secretion system Hcp family effector
MANCFLTLKLRDGGQVKGESTSKGYEEQIEIESWSFGEHHYQSSEQTAQGGKVNMEDVYFTATMDKAAMQLMKGCAMADPVEEAVLKCVREASGGRQIYFTMILKDGIITSFHLHSQETHDTRETHETYVIPVMVFSISFRQIESEYKPQKAGGELGSPHRMQHDLGKGK